MHTKECIRTDHVSLRKIVQDNLAHLIVGRLMSAAQEHWLGVRERFGHGFNFRHDRRVVKVIIGLSNGDRRRPTGSSWRFTSIIGGRASSTIGH
jgi:hypothetical protein